MGGRKSGRLFYWGVDFIGVDGYVSSLTEFLGRPVLTGWILHACRCLRHLRGPRVSRSGEHISTTVRMGEHESESSLVAATLGFALISFGVGPIALGHILRSGGSTGRGNIENSASAITGSPTCNTHQDPEAAENTKFFRGAANETDFPLLGQCRAGCDKDRPRNLGYSEVSRRMCGE